MGGIISSVMNWFSGSKEVRVLILGLDSAGKTTILYRLSLNQYVQQVAPTVAFNIEKVTFGKLTMHIWDLGGQHQLRPFWRLYYKSTDGIVFVIDSKDRERIDLCRDELNSLLSEEELKNVPLLVMANKQDLAEAMTAEEISNSLDLTKIKDRTWTIIPTSALKGDGVKAAFDWLAETIEGRTT